MANHCSHCGAPLSAGALTCPVCGAQVASRPVATGEVQRGVPAEPFRDAPLTVTGGPSGIPNAPAQTSTLAIVSLVSGISSWVALPFIGALVAIITGHMARKEIRESQGRVGGDGLALGGLWTGYLNVALGCLGVAIALMVIFGVLAWAGGGGLEGSGFPIPPVPDMPTPPTPPSVP